MDSEFCFFFSGYLNFSQFFILRKVLGSFATMFFFSGVAVRFFCGFLLAYVYGTIASIYGLRF
jgi:hypothetical protein